jgi:hypothetical protein
MRSFSFFDADECSQKWLDRIRDLETGVAQSVLDSCIREGNIHEWPEELSPETRYHEADFPPHLNRQNTQMERVSTNVLHRANRLLLRDAWFRWQQANGYYDNTPDEKWDMDAESKDDLAIAKSIVNSDITKLDTAKQFSASNHRLIPRTIANARDSLDPDRSVPGQLRVPLVVQRRSADRDLSAGVTIDCSPQNALRRSRRISAYTAETPVHPVLPENINGLVSVPDNNGEIFSDDDGADESDEWPDDAHWTIQLRRLESRRHLTSIANSVPDTIRTASLLPDNIRHFITVPADEDESESSSNDDIPLDDSPDVFASQNDSTYMPIAASLADYGARHFPFAASVAAYGALFNIDNVRNIGSITMHNCQNHAPPPHENAVQNSHISASGQASLAGHTPPREQSEPRTTPETERVVLVGQGASMSSNDRRVTRSRASQVDNEQSQQGAVSPPPPAVPADLEAMLDGLHEDNSNAEPPEEEDPDWRYADQDHPPQHPNYGTAEFFDQQFARVEEAERIEQQVRQGPSPDSDGVECGVCTTLSHGST